MIYLGNFSSRRPRIKTETPIDDGLDMGKSSPKIMAELFSDSDLWNIVICPHGDGGDGACQQLVNDDWIYMLVHNDDEYPFMMININSCDG